MTTTFPIFRGILLGLTAVLTGGTTFLIARRPTRAASRLGIRGLKRQRALLDPTWAAIEPFIRWLGVRVSGVLSDETRTKLDLTLTHAGDFMGITVDEYLAMIVCSGILGGAAGGALVAVKDMQLFFIPLLVLIGALLPTMVVDNAKGQRFQEMNRGLPYAIDLMALSMSAGLDFPGSIQQVVSRAKANESLKDELGYMLQQFHLGRTRAQVLNEFAHRVPILTVREFVNALLQAEQRGNPVANVLEIQAVTARIQRTTIAEKAAEDMRSKLMLPNLMLAAVNLMLILIPCTMMIENFATGLPGAGGSR